MADQEGEEEEGEEEEEMVVVRDDQGQALLRMGSLQYDVPQQGITNPGQAYPDLVAMPAMVLR